MDYNQFSSDLHKAIYQNKKSELNLENVLFSTFYQPFVKVVIDKINDYTIINTDSLLNIAHNLIEKLQAISIRILILEMQYLKTHYSLKGKDSKEEYRDFCEYWLKNQNYKNKIFKIYPSLYKELEETTYRFLLFIDEILKRLISDKYEIEEYIIKKSINTIKLMEFKNADTHNCGKSVVKIIFDNDESVYYKPRDLGSDLLFCEIYFQITGRRYPLRILNKGKYGWEQTVAYKGCETKSDIISVYYNLGICISIFSILGVSDLHYENVILNKDILVFIDIEVLYFYERTENGIDKQIYMTGILPTTVWETKNRNLEYSIIRNTECQETFYKFPLIINEFSSDMKIVYKNRLLERKQNIITYQGENISAYQYVSYIQQGYKEAYLKIKNKIDMKNILSKYKKTIWRYLLLDSQIYSTLLNYSHYPNIMSKNKREELFEQKIIEQTNLDSGDRILLSQIHQLKNNDIPYFTVRFNKKDLCYMSQTIEESYFDQTAMEHIKENIELMSIKRMYIGINTIFWMIYFGEFGLKKVLDESIFIKEKKTKRNWHQNSIRVERQIIESIKQKDIGGKREKDWISLLFYKDGYVKLELVSKDKYLYNGIAGIIIYLVAYSHEKRYIKCGNISDVLIKQLFSYTDMVRTDRAKRQSNKIGAYDGEASIIYTYQILYQLTKENIYIEYAKKHIEFLCTLLNDNNISLDIVSGRAGVILVLCNMYIIDKNDFYKEILIRQGHILYEESKNNHVLSMGFAHGYYGIIMALLRIIRIIGEKESGINFQNIIKYLKNKEEITRVFDMESWCHGNLGKLLCQLELYKYDSQNFFIEDIECTINSILKSKSRKSMCLCHGNIGKIEILLESSFRLKKRKLHKYCLTKLNEYLEQFNNDENRLIQEKNNMGFMQGNIGVGYSLLRCNNNKLPFVLGVEI